MLHCGACGKFLSPVGAAACSACPLKYHRACLALSEKTHLSKDWVCPTCKKHTRKGDNSQTPVKGLYESSDAGVPASSPSSGASTGASQVVGGGADEPPLSRDPGAAVQSDDLRGLRREFAECMLEMREFRKEMALLRESFTAVTSRLDGMEQRLMALEHRQAEGGDGDGRAAVLERTIAELKSELNDRDQEALLSDLEIGQLPEERGESVFRAVAVLAGRLGVTLEERDVVFAERVGAPPAEAGGRARRVVVRLARRQLRDDLLRAARVRRTGMAAGAGPRVYINERLTRPNRQLFHRVREECRGLQWRYSWTRRGRIFARQGDGTPVFQFRSSDDICRVFGPQKPVSE